MSCFISVLLSSELPVGIGFLSARSLLASVICEQANVQLTRSKCCYSGSMNSTGGVLERLYVDKVDICLPESCTQNEGKVVHQEPS